MSAKQASLSSSSSSRATGVGVDLGSQKTMIVDETGEVVRTDTGSVSRPTLISFSSKKRLFGEEASAQVSAESTIGLLNLLAGRSLEEVNALSCLQHRKIRLVADEQGRLLAEVRRTHTLTAEESDAPQRFHITTLLAMYLAHLNEQISSTVSPAAVYCFALQPQYSATVARAYKDACAIANIEKERVFFADAADALITTYARKLAGLGGAEALGLLGKRVLLVDVGYAQTTVIVAQCERETVRKIAVTHDADLGAHHFDLALFDHFANVCLSNHATKIDLNSKRGARLLAGCERIRKLLSQLNESQITVEHLLEDQDVHFSLRRDELSSLCAELIARFKKLVHNALTQALGVPIDAENNGDNSNNGTASIAAIEVLGGGLRMPVLQQALLQSVSENSGESVSLSLGAKLDDGSVALGAALLYAQQHGSRAPAAVNADVDATAAAGETAETEAASDAMDVSDNSNDDEQEESLGFTENELCELRDLERKLQTADEEVKALHSAYNALEAYILEMRNAPRSKHGQSIDANALNAALDDSETWLWDNADTATRAAFEEKLQETQEKVKTICAEYLAKVEEERLAVEAALQAEALAAEQERASRGEDGDDDHDNRKLKKADRLRLVNKNKEEGNELFAGGNYRMAMARYHKALTHSTKFFDLSPEDAEEIKGIQVALYNNLATCYSKVENHEQMLRNCEEALKLNPKSLKALFRRSQYYEHKKEFALALLDLQKCVEYNTTGKEDALVTKATERVKKEIQKEKAKEKKMWGKAFG